MFAGGEDRGREGPDPLEHLGRGAHAHEDHPDRDDKEWRKHSLAWVDGTKVRLAYRPVHLEPLTKEEAGGIDLKKIAPKKRVY